MYIYVYSSNTAVVNRSAIKVGDIPAVDGYDLVGFRSPDDGFMRETYVLSGYSYAAVYASTQKVTLYYMISATASSSKECYVVLDKTSGVSYVDDKSKPLVKTSISFDAEGYTPAQMLTNRIGSGTSSWRSSLTYDGTRNYLEAKAGGYTFDTISIILTSDIESGATSPKLRRPSSTGGYAAGTGDDQIYSSVITSSVLFD